MCGKELQQICRIGLIQITLRLLLDLFVAVKAVVQKLSDGLSQNYTEVWINDIEHFTQFCLAPVRPEPPKKSFWKKLGELFKN